MQLSHLLAVALSLATSEAAYQGFNYASTNPDGSSRSQQDFQAQFQTAKGLVGTSGGFTSARLYTMIQGGTTNSPISAIPAAISEGTSLLLGLWASGGNIDNELAALKAAISQYGDSLAKQVVGISVGSEDLYRNSPMGIESHAGIGAQPSEIVNYINEVRSTIKNTPLSSASIGHVDTWTAWVNGSNSDVINAVDWLGFDGYPYFQNTMPNSINDGKKLFDEAVAHTQSASGGKPVWMTETGWPVSGQTMNLAVPSVANAKQYWDQVGCPLFGKVNTWWYTLQDASGSVVPNPSFGIVGSTLSTTPLFDLSCTAAQSSVPPYSAGSSSSSQSSSSAGKTSSSGSSKPASSSGGSGSSAGGSSTGASSTGGSSTGGSSSTKAASKSGKGAQGFHTAAAGKGSSTAAAGSTSSTPVSSGGASASAAAGSSSSPSPTASFNGASQLSGSVFAVVMAVFALAATA